MIGRIVGMITILFFGVLLIGCWILPDDGLVGVQIFCTLVFGSLMGVGLALILHEHNYRIGYKDRKITLTNTFGKTKVYDCQEIETAYLTDWEALKLTFKDGTTLRLSLDEKSFIKN